MAPYGSDGLTDAGYEEYEADAPEEGYEEVDAYEGYEEVDAPYEGYES